MRIHAASTAWQQYCMCVQQDAVDSARNIRRCTASVCSKSMQEEGALSLFGDVFDCVEADWSSVE